MKDEKMSPETHEKEQQSGPRKTDDSVGNTVTNAEALDPKA